MTDSTTDSKKTAFHNHHVAAGARMVDFAGYRMPVQYTGITDEHLTVRNKVGLFDLSHMGEFEVSGPGALKFLQTMTTNNVADLQEGQIQYSCMTKSDGGIIDDLLVYRLSDRYLLVVNAANISKDFNWLRDHLEGDAALENRSDVYSLLAIQGPEAQKLMTEVTDYNLDSMAYYTSATARICGREVLFSRTGYTGEDGFEIYIEPDDTEALWQGITEAGDKYDLKLIGLGARDTLRLEMKMALYGNDIDESTNPIEAGLSWICCLDKDFVGRDAIARVKEEKPARRLVCLELEGRVVPRHGYDIVNGEKVIGTVTSGTHSPSLQKPIGLGYVPRERAKSGSTVGIAVRDKTFPATVVKPPFYKKASHR